MSRRGRSHRFCRLGTLLAAAAALLGPIGPVATAAETRPLVILIGIDGFRWDFQERAPTPHLDRLAARGVRAERLIPVFPTKTFPNHYTLVTGLYPGRHGIVANSMYDPVFDAYFSLGDRKEVADGRWYEGEPVWITAERRGLPTAPIFWPGSEAEINGLRPSFWRPFDGRLTAAERVDLLLSQLDRPGPARPVFLTLYFNDLDDAGHQFGPDPGPALAAALRSVDAGVGRLVAGLEALRLLESAHLILVSDHGNVAISPRRVIFLDDFVDPAQANVVDWGPVLALWPEEGRVESIYRALAGAHPRLAVYRREEIPERFHYRRHRRIPPILALADEGWTISTRRYFHERPDRFAGGDHGYDNRLVSMGSLFLAAGPAFRRGAVVPPFESVHVYELICHILGLPPAPNDGDLDRIRQVLSPAIEQEESTP